MAYSLRLSQSVYNSLLEQMDIYEAARTGYGEKFEEAFFLKLKSIELQPLQGRIEIIEGKEVRIVPFPLHKPKFRHVIIFQVFPESQIIDILRIPHTSSDWRK